MAKNRPIASMRLGLILAAGLILVLQAAASRMVKIDELAISIPGLHQLPSELGGWKQTGEQAMDSNVVNYLKPDEYILRDYTNSQRETINLFVAYFKSVQNIYGPHSPAICLPGAGWAVTSSKIVNVPVEGWREPIPVNRYTMQKGEAHIAVLYWYQNDRDAWAEEFHAKLRLLPDLLRYRRSDVSLVRLITASRDERGQAEIESCMEFMQRLFPPLAARFASVTAQRP